MSAILEGMEGTLCLMDDVLVVGKTEEEHNTRFEKVLKRIQKSGATLNLSKCEFNKSKLIFLGHLIDGNGIRPDPQKTIAVRQMPTPQNITELRRFLGMTNPLGKFSDKLAELSQPLRELLSKKKQWR